MKLQKSEPQKTIKQSGTKWKLNKKPGTPVNVLPEGERKGGADVCSPRGTFQATFGGNARHHQLEVMEANLVTRWNQIFDHRITRHAPLAGGVSPKVETASNGRACCCRQSTVWNPGQ